jgi:hypothetical protein
LLTHRPGEGEAECERLRQQLTGSAAALDDARCHVGGLERALAAATATCATSQDQLREAQQGEQRLQLCAVAKKAGRNLALTEVGETVLRFARSLVDLNDEATVAMCGPTTKAGLGSGYRKISIGSNDADPPRTDSRMSAASCCTGGVSVADARTSDGGTDGSAGNPMSRRSNPLAEARKP